MTDCFNAVPFNSTTRTRTLQQVTNLFGLYSFTEIARNSGAPYNVAIDLTTRLNQIANKTYTNDLQFHLDISALYNLYSDAHLLYTVPSPYSRFSIFRPFFFDSIVTNGVQQLWTTGSTFTIATYQTLYGIDLTPYIGKQIISVNGVNAITWAQNFANAVGVSLDPAGRFNNVLYNGFGAGTLSAYTVSIGYVPPLNETYTFAGNNNAVTLPSLFVPALTTTGLNDFTSYIYSTSVSKKREEEENNNIGPIEKTLKKLYPQEHPIKTVELPPIFKQQQQQQQQQKRAESAVPVSPRGVVCFSMPWNQTVVVKIPSMSSDIDESYTALVNCISIARTNNWPNLILDVRGNGGGFLAYAYLLLATIVPGWRNNLSVLEPYDTVVNSVTDRLPSQFISNFIASQPYYINPATNRTWSPTNAWYTNAVTYTRGGVSTRYSRKTYLNETSFITTTQLPAAYTFSKILLLTDGLCGSACSLFISKLRFYGLGANVATGGLFNQVMETSTFAGGAVLQWNSFLAEVDSASSFSSLPTSASMSFNYLELYLGNSTTPRQYLRYPAEFRLNIWRIDNEDLEAVYNSTASFFSNSAYNNIRSLGSYYTSTFIPGTSPLPTPTQSSSSVIQVSINLLLLAIIAVLLF